MIIRHVSDTHGFFHEATQDFDITVISGDVVPNAIHFNPSYKKDEAIYQEHWIKRNTQRLLDWSQGKRVYYILGNHDFYNEGSLARQLGWININNAWGYERSKGNGELISFYGFPWIPECGGNWNYELNEDEMRLKVEAMYGEFLYIGFPEVLVTHSPPYGILDAAYYGTMLGNKYLRNLLEYRMDVSVQPKLVLFGHIHESPGIQEHFGMKFSNAATTQNYLEI